MILGLGIDILEVSRIERELSRDGEAFLDAFLHRSERDRAAGGASPAADAAGRFALKEASLKALGAGRGSGIVWSEIRTHCEPGARPTLRLFGAARRRAESIGVRRVHAAWTLRRGVAAAAVVLEGDARR